MLLHYAVLRKIFAHPGQRPGTMVSGLRAVPFWHPRLPAAAAGLPPGLEFVRVLERPESVATFRRELLGLRDGEAGLNGDVPGNVGAGCGTDAAADDVVAAVAAGRPQNEGIHEGGAWSEHDLIREGRPVSGAQANFPASMAILRAASAALDGDGDVDGAHWAFINARISTVQPGTHITPHCGVTNARLRAHLGLSVPTGGGRAGGVFKSGLRVDTGIQSWEVGKVVVFDDSFEHEVWWQVGAGADTAAVGGGGGGGPRVVLIVDIFHPDLSPAQKAFYRNQMSDIANNNNNC